MLCNKEGIRGQGEETDNLSVLPATEGVRPDHNALRSQEGARINKLGSTLVGAHLRQFRVGGTARMDDLAFQTIRRQRLDAWTKEQKNLWLR